METKPLCFAVRLDETTHPPNSSAMSAVLSTAPEMSVTMICISAVRTIMRDWVASSATGPPESSLSPVESVAKFSSLENKAAGADSGRGSSESIASADISDST